MTPPPLVVVTGSSRGIGRATGLAFAREGCRVLLTARSREALDAVRREVEALGAEARTVSADLTRDAAASALAEAVEAWGGVLDVLVNNAGLFRAAPFTATDVEAHWRELLDVNLTGTFLTTLRLMPSLERAARPWIFNVLSTAARQGFPWNAGYAASKWGARGLTEVLRAEYPESPRLTAIYPGATDTDAWIGAPFPHDRRKMLRPEEVAAAIVGAWKGEAYVKEIVLDTPPGAVG
jgi:3-oxoacyl-[acyl-carrier protein] reductase